MFEVTCLTIGCNQKHGHLGPHGDVQTIRRDLGSYNSGPVGRQNEEWSARDVRPANQSDHRFCGVSEETLRAMCAVNLPAAVTLEGLAAVIGSLSEALHALGGDRDENRQTIAALVKSAEAVTALLTTEVKASDELTAAKKALSALTDPKGHIWHGDGGECTGECKDVRKVLGIKEPTVDGIEKLIAHTQGRTTFRALECFKGRTMLVAHPHAEANPLWVASMDVPTRLAVEAFEAGGLDGFDAFCRRAFADELSARSGK